MKLYNDKLTKILDKYLLKIKKKSNCDWGIFLCKQLKIYNLYNGEKTIIMDDITDSVNDIIDNNCIHPIKLSSNIYYANVCMNCSIKVENISIIINNYMKIYVEDESNNIIGVFLLINSSKDYKDIYMEIKEYYDLLHFFLNNSISLINIPQIPQSPQDLFLANMSHEIRTPLNGIIGSSQLLQHTSMTDKQIQYLSTVNQCGLQLLQIINDILDYTKLTTNKMVIKNKSVNMREIFEVVEKTLYTKAHEKNIKPVFINNVPEYVILDKQKLIQILVNLYSNSIKFSMENNQVIITVDHSNEDNDKEEHELIFSVKDYGIGIKDSDIEKLFKSFSQIDCSYAKEQCGTGLGLVISEKLCKLMNGKMWVDSKLGFGSIFYFTIKYKNYLQMKSNIQSVKSYENFKDKNILIVDDNSVNRLCLTQTIMERGMNPISCSNAIEALKIIKSDYDIHIGLIDIKMPKIDGITLAECIKEIRPTLPLVAISSVEDIYIHSINFEQKLIKPINELQLLDCLNDIICKYTFKSDQQPKMLDNIKLSIKSKFKILIAEDIKYNQVVLVNFLEVLNYTNIKVVSDGEEAINEIDNNDYDVILLDLKMPKKSGYDVAKYIKSTDKNKPHIIIMSASVLEVEKLTCIKLGINDFIEKPVNIHDLRNLLYKLSS